MAERSVLPPTLLYVENDPNDQLLFLRTAARARVDFSIQAFADLKAAQDYILGRGPFRDRESYPFPVLVLLDFNLGSWCGLTLLKWVRQDPTFSHLTVIMFSDSGLGGRFSGCYEHGADHCLEKPTSMAGMVQVILCLDRCIKEVPMSFAELKTLPYHFPSTLPERIGSPVYR